MCQQAKYWGCITPFNYTPGHIVTWALVHNVRLYLGMCVDTIR